MYSRAFGVGPDEVDVPLKILDMGPSVGRSLSNHGSHGVSFAPILRPGTVGVVRMRVDAGGVIALHPTRFAQLFLVVEGRGWVRVESGAHVAVEAGQAAFWEAGEVHESGSDSGMTAIVIEGPDLAPELPRLPGSE